MPYQIPIQASLKQLDKKLAGLDPSSGGTPDVAERGSKHGKTVDNWDHAAVERLDGRVAALKDGSEKLAIVFADLNWEFRSLGEDARTKTVCRSLVRMAVRADGRHGTAPYSKTLSNPWTKSRKGWGTGPIMRTKTWSLSAGRSERSASWGCLDC